MVHTGFELLISSYTVVCPLQAGYVCGKFCLLPFDEFYEKNGRVDKLHTTMVSL